MKAGKREDSELVLKIVGESAMDPALRVIRDVGGYQYIAYHLAHRANAPADLPYFKSTYPYSWIGKYLRDEYFNIDPVILDGFTRSEPFFWSDLDWSLPQCKALTRDARAHGIGGSGYSIPLTDRVGRKAMFTVTSALDDGDWRRKIDIEAGLLAQLSEALHRKAIALAFGTSPAPCLTPREIDSLSLVARGKSVPRIARTLGISEHTVRDYLKSSRTKLGCSTTAQAVHEATRRHLV